MGFLFITVCWWLVRKRQWNCIYLTIHNSKAGEELGLQLTRSRANEDNSLSVPVLNNKNTEELSRIFKKATLFSSLKIMEYSVSLQTPEIPLLTIKCLYITHVLRDEFKEELRALSEFLSANQTSWTCFLPFYFAKPAPAGSVSAAKWEQGAHPALQVCSAGLREVLSCPGGYPSTNWIFFMPESAQWQQGRAQVTGFVRQSQRALGCLVIFCLFAAFGFGRIGPVWALRDQNYFLPVIRSLCTLKLHIKWLKRRIWIKFNLKALMGCDHSRTPSREYVAKEKKNHPQMSLIS